MCKRIITFKKVLKKFCCDKCSEHGELLKINAPKPVYLAEPFNAELLRQFR